MKNTLHFIVKCCFPFFLLELKTKSVQAFRFPCLDVLMLKRGDWRTWSVCSDRTAHAAWLTALPLGFLYLQKCIETRHGGTGGSLSIQGQPGVHSDFQDSQRYMLTPSLIKKKKASETIPFASVHRLKVQTPTMSPSSYETHPVHHPEWSLHSHEMAHIFSGRATDGIALTLAFFSLCRHAALRIKLEWKGRLASVVSTGFWTLSEVMAPSFTAHMSLSSCCQSGSCQSALVLWKRIVILFSKSGVNRFHCE